MPLFAAKGQVEEASIRAVKILKDGTKVDLGVVSYWHANPLKRLWWNLTQLFKGAPQ